VGQIYYIDGYNVIHHSSQLRPLAMENFEAAREALVEKVSHFCVATGSEAKIIFDGRGRKQDVMAPRRAVPHVEILYSPGHLTADTLIERIVYKTAERRSLIVVSADRGIRNLCGNLNALVMQPDSFLASVNDAGSQTRVVLQQMQKPSNSQCRVEERLNTKGLDLLLELKKKLEK